MALKDLWRRLTGSHKRDEEETDAREGRSLSDTSTQGQQRYGPQWHKPADQEKPKH